NTPHITTLSLLDATAGVSSSNALSEDGRVGTVTWRIASGSLPPGITLDSSTGTLHGTPTVPAPGELNLPAQLYNFTMQVSDAATPTHNVATQAFTLRLITPV